MAVTGNLSSMPFPELLQWLGGNGRSGILEIERDRVVKRLTFKGGHVIATASNDPRELLGHFLVSRGQITEDLLHIALAQQETGGKPLGLTLVEMGVLSSEELIRNLSAQAEESIFSVFEFEDAVFRFHPGTVPDDSNFPIDIRVEDILLRGMQRLDEVRRIRAVFDDPGIVVQRTEKLPPPEVFRNKVARRIYESIDGERTVEDIVLHAHGSEFLVTKFLFELHRTALVSIREVRRRPAPPPPPHPRPAAPGPSPGPRRVVRRVAAAPPPEPPAVSVAAPAAPSQHPPEPTRYDTALEKEVLRAGQLMARGDFAEALDVLGALYRKHPANESLRRLTQEAEAAFVDKAYKHYLPGDKVPHLVRPLDDLQGIDLSPQDFFLLSRIDGTWSLKAIVQIAPIREVDALRMLKRMRDTGVIELRDPA